MIRFRGLDWYRYISMLCVGPGLTRRGQRLFGLTRNASVFDGPYKAPRYRGHQH